MLHTALDAYFSVGGIPHRPLPIGEQVLLIVFVFLGARGKYDGIIVLSIPSCTLSSVSVFVPRWQHAFLWYKYCKTVIMSPSLTSL